MKKILLCNTDVLLSNCHDKVLTCDVLQVLNKMNSKKIGILFITRNNYKANKIRKICDKYGGMQFKVASRKWVKQLVELKPDMRKRLLVLGNKEVDFHLAVNSKLLLITPLWLECEQKNRKYGVGVDNPAQLLQLLSVIAKHKHWYAEIDIDSITRCISLYDARTMIPGINASERQIIKHFQHLLKEGISRSYYKILFYYFITNMTHDDTFDDITIYGVVPSSKCSVNKDLFRFSEQIRYIKKIQIPRKLADKSPEEQNILIRHTEKQQQHGGSQVGRSQIGGVHEFNSLCLNMAYKDKIEKLRQKGKLNICIFDDYMNYGNGFNAIRCLFESIGANKIIFVSMGLFRFSFYRKDYEITGDVFKPGYHYTLTDEIIETDFKKYSDAKDEIDLLYKIYNNT